MGLDGRGRAVLENLPYFYPAQRRPLVVDAFPYGDLEWRPSQADIVGPVPDRKTEYYPFVQRG